MRSNIPFDTHAFVKDLVAAGVPEAQAEVHARILGEVVVERLASKEDIGSVRSELRLCATKEDLAILRQEMRGDLGAMELRMTMRFGAMLATAVAIVAVLVKLL